MELLTGIVLVTSPCRLIPHLMHSSLDFSGDLQSANKAAIMGVVLHYSIIFMLYLHSLRTCFGCLDGKISLLFPKFPGSV